MKGDSYWVCLVCCRVWETLWTNIGQCPHCKELERLREGNVNTNPWEACYGPCTRGPLAE